MTEGVPRYTAREAIDLVTSGFTELPGPQAPST
jgi:hypothetical protein